MMMKYAKRQLVSSAAGASVEEYWPSEPMIGKISHFAKLTELPSAGLGKALVILRAIEYQQGSVIRGVKADKGNHRAENNP